MPWAQAKVQSEARTLLVVDDREANLVAMEALLGDGDRSPIVPEVVNEGLTLENTGFGAGEGELPRTREVERAAGWLTVVGKLTEDNGFAGFQSAVRVEVIDVD